MQRITEAEMESRAQETTLEEKRKLFASKEYLELIREKGFDDLGRWNW